MFVPPARIATKKEEATYVPQSGLGEYLEASFVEGFVEGGGGFIGLKAQAIFSEYEAYKDVYAYEEKIKKEQEARIGIFSTPIETFEKKQSPELSRERWGKSKYYRKGMKYEEGITEARLKVYADWYDAKKSREDIFNRRDAGFFDGTVGFLAGLAGSVVDPVNLITFGVASGATLGVKVAAGGAENIAAELALQTVTQEQREYAGIAPTMEERMLNVAFAGLIGGAFPAIGHIVSSRLKAGEVKPPVPENIDPVKVNNDVHRMTSQALNTMTVKERANILDRLDRSLNDETLRIGTHDVSIRTMTESTYYRPDGTMMEPWEVVIDQVFSGDSDVARAFLKAVDMDEPSVRSALISNKSIEKIKAETPAQPVTRAETESVRFGVEDDIDIEIETPDFETEIRAFGGNPEEFPLLQGKKLYDIADAETTNFEKATNKAVELITTDGCL